MGKILPTSLPTEATFKALQVHERRTNTGIMSPFLLVADSRPPIKSVKCRIPSRNDKSSEKVWSNPPSAACFELDTIPHHAHQIASTSRASHFSFWLLRRSIPSRNGPRRRGHWTLSDCQRQSLQDNKGREQVRHNNIIVIRPCRCKRSLSQMCSAGAP